MSSPHRFLFWLALSVGCSSGAASGTGAPNPNESPSPTDAGRKDGGAVSLEPTDAGEDADDEDAGSVDGGATDSGTEGGADAAAESGSDASTGLDAAADATSDASSDASSDSSVSDAAPDAAPDAGTDAGTVACTIDDGTWVTPLTQYDLIAKGKLWSIDEDGSFIESFPLASIPGLAQGPCQGQTGVCKLDATTWRDDQSQYHIVSGGKLWRVTLDGNLISSTTLTDIPGIAAGPCVGKTGAACTFEAGAWRSDLSQYHLVADGKLWMINGTTGALVGSTNLTSIAGVAAGPCAGQVGTCHVDAFTFRPATVSTDAEIHVIAKGNLYVLDTAGTLESTTSLLAIPGMANGPCK